MTDNGDDCSNDDGNNDDGNDDDGNDDDGDNGDDDGQNYSLLEQTVDILIKQLMKISTIYINIKC